MEGISELCLVTQASSPDCDVFNVKKTQGLKAKPVHRRRVVSHISTCRNVRVFLVKTSASESGGRNWNPPLPKTPGAGICCDMPASHVQSRLHSLTLITASRSAEVNKNPFPGWSLLTAWLGYVQEDCFFFCFFPMVESLIILSGGCGRLAEIRVTHFRRPDFPTWLLSHFSWEKIYGPPNRRDRLLPRALKSHHSSEEANVSHFLEDLTQCC